MTFKIAIHRVVACIVFTGGIMTIQAVVFMFHFHPDKFSPWSAVGVFSFAAFLSSVCIWLAVTMLGRAHTLADGIPEVDKYLNAQEPE